MDFYPLFQLLRLTDQADRPRTISPLLHRKGQKLNKNLPISMSCRGYLDGIRHSDGLWGGGKAQRAEEIAGTHQCLADSLQSSSLAQKSHHFASPGRKTGSVSQWAFIRTHHLRLTFSRQVCGLLNRLPKLRHSFTATLVEPALNDKGFSFSDMGSVPLTFMTTSLWPRYSTVLSTPPPKGMWHFQSQWQSSQLGHKNSLH